MFKLKYIGLGYNIKFRLGKKSKLLIFSRSRSFESKERGEQIIKTH
jgi:hypothetical protein